MPGRGKRWTPKAITRKCPGCKVNAETPTRKDKLCRNCAMPIEAQGKINTEVEARAKK